MILYKGGEDILVRKVNHSIKYCTGASYKTNNFGYVTVVAMEDKYYTYYQRGNLCKSYKYFIVEFTDGTKVQAQLGDIREGKIRNPNHPSVYEIGFTGQGAWKVVENGRKTKEYVLWYDMLKRCYSEEYHKEYPTYKACTVDPRWNNFQLFCEDIQYLGGYKEWKRGGHKIGKYELDKDIKVKGNKLYSPYTCVFLSHKENNGRYNKKQTVTGLTYIATRLSDKYEEEFTNQAEFAEKYSLHRRGVNSCCVGKRKTTGGWMFEIKKEST